MSKPPTRSSRRTKIVFTLGPACESEEMLSRLILAGGDVLRLNMAHATHDWTRMIVRRIREVSAKVERDVAIMMDIKGPEIRTGDLTTPIELRPGEIFDFTVKPGAPRLSSEEVRSVDVNYQDLVRDIKIGDTVLVDSGLIRLEVLGKDAAHIRCRVLIPGELKSRRHINLPGVKVNLPRIRWSASKRESIFSRYRSCARPRISNSCENSWPRRIQRFESSRKLRISRRSITWTESFKPATPSWWPAAILASNVRSRSYPSSSAGRSIPASRMESR